MYEWGTKKEHQKEIAWRNDKFRDIAEINNFFMYHRRIICLVLRKAKGETVDSSGCTAGGRRDGEGIIHIH